MQSFVVITIVLIAAIYLGWQAWKKSRAFSARKSCDVDCGCGKSQKTSKLSLSK